MAQHTGLLCLDMDRVLVNHLSTWQVVYDALDTNNDASFAAYNQGLLDEWAWIKEDLTLIEEAFHTMHGTPANALHLDTILETTPMMDGLDVLIGTALEEGWAVAIVSGGVHVTAHRIAARFPSQRAWSRRWGGIEARYAPEGRDTMLHVFTNGWLSCLGGDENGALRPLGRYQVQMNGKGAVVAMLQRRLGIERERTVSVGDSAGDIGMFQASGLPICFNPWDERPLAHANEVITTLDLREVLKTMAAKGLRKTLN